MLIKLYSSSAIGERTPLDHFTENSRQFLICISALSIVRITIGMQFRRTICNKIMTVKLKFVSGTKTMTKHDNKLK